MCNWFLRNDLMNAVVAIVLVNVILVSYVWSAIKEERNDERVEKSSEKGQDERSKRSVSPRKRTAKEIKGE
jgi:hypothetical protein